MELRDEFLQCIKTHQSMNINKLVHLKDLYHTEEEIITQLYIAETQKAPTSGQGHEHDINENTYITHLSRYLILLYISDAIETRQPTSRIISLINDYYMTFMLQYYPEDVYSIGEKSNIVITIAGYTPFDIWYEILNKREYTQMYSSDMHMNNNESIFYPNLLSLNSFRYQLEKLSTICLPYKKTLINGILQDIDTLTQSVKSSIDMD